MDYWAPKRVSRCAASRAIFRVAMYRVVRSALEELRGERAAIDVEMRRDVGEDAGQRTDAETRMIRDRDVMLTALLRREPHVAPRFARDVVSIASKARARSRPERSRGSRPIRQR